MIIKTRASRVDELFAFIQTNHPYGELCEVLVTAIPINNKTEAFLKWIEGAVGEKTEE